MGGCPGLLVMGGDSRSSRSRSWVRITAQYTGWTFFHRPICCKICNVSLKRQKNWIRGQGWPILNKKSGHWLWPRWQSGRFQNQKSNLGIGNDNISMFRYLNPGHRLNMHDAKSPVKQPAYELGTFRWRRHHPHFPLTTNRRWPKWRRLCLYRFTQQLAPSLFDDSGDAIDGGVVVVIVHVIPPQVSFSVAFVVGVGFAARWKDFSVVSKMKQIGISWPAVVNHYFIVQTNNAVQNLCPKSIFT